MVEVQQVTRTKEPKEEKRRKRDTDTKTCIEPYRDAETSVGPWRAAVYLSLLKRRPFIRVWCSSYSAFSLNDLRRRRLLILPMHLNRLSTRLWFPAPTSAAAAIKLSALIGGACQRRIPSVHLLIRNALNRATVDYAGSKVLLHGVTLHTGKAWVNSGRCHLRNLLLIRECS